MVNYNEMLTAVRHDLKSPLSSIKGLAELSLILHPDLSEDLHENLNGIVQVSDSSVSLISNVLARRETKLDLQVTNVGQMIDKILQLVDLRYFSVRRKVDVDSATMDSGLMEHALLNLISNARKFSAGGLEVGVQKVRKAGTVDVEEIEFWVWNDGAVINGEQRTEIFKPGMQTEEGKAVGGHGLGLAIVKSIAEAHHGRVNVESHIKVGTTFRINIPMLTATAPESESTIPVSIEDSAAQLEHVLASSK
jgi:signal transduction histidine kinase